MVNKKKNKKKIVTAQIEMMEMRREATCPASHTHTHATFMAHSFFISLLVFLHSLLYLFIHFLFARLKLFQNAHTNHTAIYTSYIAISVGSFVANKSITFNK